MSRDWHAWYADYDDPASSLARRLAEVRRLLGGLVRPGVRLTSLCSGDGRDTLPVLAERAPDATAVLVEIDAALAATARENAAALGLGGVSVRTADAGTTGSLHGVPPADVLMLCGIFGNISDEDVRTTIAAAPSLLAPGGHVVWTRGAKVPHDPTRVDGDPAEWVRDRFAESGFEEAAFVRPDDASFRIGVHRLTASPQSFRSDERLFRFV